MWPTTVSTRFKWPSPYKRSYTPYIYVCINIEVARPPGTDLPYRLLDQSKETIIFVFILIFVHR